MVLLPTLGVHLGTYVTSIIVLEKALQFLMFHCLTIHTSMWLDVQRSGNNDKNNIFTHMYVI